jgi:hypothetical protein
MRIVSSFVAVTLLMLLSLPGVSDAFSRRTSHSEVAHTAPLHTTTTDQSPGKTSSDISAQAVPEPPMLWLMTLGIGLLGIGMSLRRARQTGARQE